MGTDVIQSSDVVPKRTPPNVLLFIYDLQMDPGIFKAWNGVTPISTRPAAIDKHMVFFSRKGFRGCAPCFPNVIPIGTESDIVHGVVHEITRSSFEGLHRWAQEYNRYEYKSWKVKFYDGSSDYAIVPFSTQRTASVVEFKKYTGPQAYSPLPSKWLKVALLETAEKQGLDKTYVRK